MRISYPESLGSLASGWLPGETGESEKNQFFDWLSVMALPFTCIVLPQKSCGPPLAKEPEDVVRVNESALLARTDSLRIRDEVPDPRERRISSQCKNADHKVTGNFDNVLISGSHKS